VYELVQDQGLEGHRERVSHSGKTEHEVQCIQLVSISVSTLISLKSCRFIPGNDVASDISGKKSLLCRCLKAKEKEIRRWREKEQDINERF